MKKAISGSDWITPPKSFPYMLKRDTKVFRFVCELKEPVDQTILQHALDKTVRYSLYTVRYSRREYSGII